MISFVRGLALALMAGLCLVLGAPAQGGCVGLSGTADGFDKETAVSRAQLALADYVKEYKAAKHLSAVNVSAMRASPQPYWRSSVSDNQFCFGINCGIYKPDAPPAQRFAGSSGGILPISFSYVAAELQRSDDFGAIPCGKDVEGHQ